MTSLIAWIGVDSRGPASIYLASDSRISWENRDTWDLGRKVFASYRYPDILGYYGDVLFTSQVLGQVISLIDADSLFKTDSTPESKFEAICTMLKQAHSTYPEKMRRTFSIVHCSRRDSRMSASFALSEFSWEPNRGWQTKVIPVPTKSDVAAIYGSGERNVLESIQQWKRSEVGGTSRSIFSAFCDSLASGSDPATGGSAQLVGIYRQGAAKLFGVIYKKRRYLQGLCVDGLPYLGGVEWFNELFERCDWETMDRFNGAQPQPRPHNL
ncbi:hypothetical protein ACFLVX_02980 [Chloroflexota bacterium]